MFITFQASRADLAGNLIGGCMRAGLVIFIALGLAACGSDRALEEQRRSFEGQLSSLQARVSSLETERQALQEERDTSLEEEYSFVLAQLEESRARLGALEVRRDALRIELEAAGIEVAPLQTEGEAQLREMLESALSGGDEESTGGADMTGGLLETGGSVGGENRGGNTGGVD